MNVIRHRSGMCEHLALSSSLSAHPATLIPWYDRYRLQLDRTGRFQHAVQLILGVQVVDATVLRRAVVASTDELAVDPKKERIKKRYGGSE